MWILVIIIMLVAVAAGFVVGFCLGIDFEIKRRKKKNEKN